MVGFIWRQLRARLGRSLALLAGVLVATTGFVVLTGTTTTSQLRLNDQVHRETRAAYDILVRPNGTQTDLETQRGVVRPNYLSGLFGGISLAQYEQVRTVGGVDVAAPVAMLGYSLHEMRAHLDLTDVVDRSLDRQVIRVDPTFLAERGLSRTTGKPRYVYLTRNRLAYPVWEDGGVQSPTLYTDGRRYPLNACRSGYIVPREIFPDGHTEPVCNIGAEPTLTRTSPETDYTEVAVARLLPHGRFENSPHDPVGLPDNVVTATDRLVLPVRWIVPFLLAAVDPPAEDRLVGLTDAVVDGRPLTRDDTTVTEQIAARTGLDVDVTFGSSPAPQTVELPAGSFGRPELRLTEGWSSIGVASVIIRAVDRKSVVLFLLVLTVCALFLGNAVTAAVRDRRNELAVLACLGWPARRIGAAILGEVALIGLAAGVLSLLLAAPLGALLGVQVGWWRAALAVPVALLVAVVAGAGPAVRAARSHPAAALRPAAAPVRRIRRVRGVLGLALLNLARAPGRALLGAAALGIGVAASTVLAAINYAFRDTVLGSLLGETVSATVRTADTVAATATVLLGAAAVADVLYLNIRDRAAELAALRATGWTESALIRLAAYEGAGIGLLGALAGTAVGLAGAAALIGGLSTGVVLTGVGTAAAGALVACLAALVPVALLRRVPTGHLLAEE
ncbi:FtsX-like permease family protein [Plantactinospora sp. KLBMP9567]|uniref:FtsX-like permease family protein n=1 Tax=Plantactinospora sp. KLBMP9567 TaxID=3085900 RepID=UPI002980E2DD|nr:FtsX-like permease family protein [Plantactinospora sp. KLBMP9567]MDW5324567.1 FtsX-like permease family protein [Plantactinospora sp. KLBMP9567]